MPGLSVASRRRGRGRLAIRARHGALGAIVAVLVLAALRSTRGGGLSQFAMQLESILFEANGTHEVTSANNNSAYHLRMGNDAQQRSSFNGTTADASDAPPTRNIADTTTNSTSTAPATNWTDYFQRFVNNVATHWESSLPLPIAPMCVGLRGFPARSTDLEAAPLPAHVATKDEYFRHLASRGILPGRQVDPERGLCLRGANGAELLSAERLSAAGYGFVAFVGDSLAREAAHAAIRLVEGDVAQCQPWATGQRLHVTNTPQRLSTHRFPGDCCARGPTTVFHAIDDMLDGLDSFMAQLNAACPCKGILYMETGLHVVFDGEVERKYGTAEGREAYTHDTMARLAARNPHDRALVWASPGAIDLVTMGLPPAKPDMHQFVNTDAPAVLAAWREMDERAIARLNAAGNRAAYAPQHEVSAAYRGLSNDGIHFGEKGLGFSFPVVTDVLTQLWLHRVLRPDEAPLGIC